MQQALETMQARLSESVEHVASITEKLQRAEKRLDRFQSASVHAVEHPGQEARKEPTPPEKGSDSTQEAPPSDANSNATAEALANVQQELEGVRDVAHARERALEAVRAELLEAKQSCAQWQLQAQHVPDDRIRHHPLYQAVHADMAYLHQELEHARTTLATCERENAEMREFRADFLHQTTTQANTHSEELQKQLRARVLLVFVDSVMSSMLSCWSGDRVKRSVLRMSMRPSPSWRRRTSAWQRCKLKSRGSRASSRLCGRRRTLMLRRQAMPTSPRCSGACRRQTLRVRC